MELVYEKGYNGVGLQKILNEAMVPKGSFYYYFDSKEDFGLKLIDFYANNTLDFLKTFLGNKEHSPKKRIFDLFEAVKETYISQGFLKGCLLGNCSLELGNEESFGQNIARNFSKWQSLFEQTIAEGQEGGTIKDEYSASEYAAFLLNSWEGALVRMKSEKSIEPMNLFIQFMKKLL